MNFDDVKVDVARGTLSYPKLEGFVLDHDRMYATAETFAPHCGSIEMTLRQAIWSQLSSFRGAADINRLIEVSKTTRSTSNG